MRETGKIPNKIRHRGKTDDWPIISPQMIFKIFFLLLFFVCYQDRSEYVGLLNIEQWFHSEPALTKCDKTLPLLSTPYNGKTTPNV